MNLEVVLSRRIGINDINNILLFATQNNKRKQELYNLLFDEDEAVGYQAAWVFTHFSAQDNKWLYDKQNELIDEVLVCKHGGKRRLILTLLYKQPFSEPLRVDLLDFCFERMLSGQELPGVQSLCIKIAYELCRPIPELMQELKVTLEMLQGDLKPAIRCVKGNILKAMQKGKSLQKM